MPQMGMCGKVRLTPGGGGGVFKGGRGRWGAEAKNAVQLTYTESHTNMPSAYVEQECERVLFVCVRVCVSVRSLHTRALVCLSV